MFDDDPPLHEEAELRRAEDDLVIRQLWVDHHGRVQHTVSVTTLPLEDLQAKATAMRHSMNLLYLSLGWELLDVQVEVPDRRVLVDRRRRVRQLDVRRASSEDSARLPLLPERPRHEGRVLIRQFGKKS